MTKTINGKIKHIVVLMFENRSFDHMLGGLPGVNGVLQADRTVNPAFYNTMSPKVQPDPMSNPPVFPTPIDLSGQSMISHDFNHDFGDGMMPDLFGPGTTGYVNGVPINAPAITYPANNSGFLSTIAYNANGQPNGPGVMSFFEKDSLKVFHQLASEFVICDNWHCDLPGHTKPNRSFMHCATCGDLGIDDDNSGTEDAKTIYEQIEQMGYDWKMYTPGGWLDSNFLEGIINSPYTNVPIAQFTVDVKNGNLPFYSFLMCGLGAHPDSSMHPANRVEPGENFLAAIYNVLRNSAHWDDTLLVVNFDENGGIYDHVLPPQTVSPDPARPIYYGTNNDGSQAKFDFSLLGVRIPALLISPWLSKGVDSTLYQNTSILRYLQDLIASPASPVLSLTQRDAKANSIAGVFNAHGSPAMRTDCPSSVVGYADFGGGNIDDPNAFKPTQEHLQQAPLAYMISLAKEYLGGLPGHADSAKPMKGTFANNAELIDYANERVEAAKKYFAAKK